MSFLRIYCLLFFLLLTGYLTAQDMAGEKSTIVWVGEWPDRNLGRDKNFSGRLNNLLFGKKEEILSKPVNVISDSSGTLWILSQGNGSVITSRNGGGKQVAGIETAYPSLVSLCLVPGTGLLFTDSYLDEAFLCSGKKHAINSFTKNVKLDQPTGIAWSPVKKEVWIAETGKHRISVFDTDGLLKYSFGKRGSGPGEFNFPTYITIDNQGRAYVIDALNFRVQAFSPEGEYLFSFGQQGSASGYLAGPKGIATDNVGNIYIVDALFNAVQVFNARGELLYYFGKQGSGNGDFWMPMGIFIDREGRIFVADSYNNRIQEFKLLTPTAHE